MRPAVLLAGVWTIGVGVALALPAHLVADWVRGSDAVLHGVVFGVAAALWAIALPQRRRTVGAALVGLAGASEAWQGALLAGRGAEWTDLGANLVGIAAGLTVAALGGRIRRQRSTRRSASALPRPAVGTPPRA